MLSKQMYSLWWYGLLLAGVLVVASVAPAVEVGEKAPDFTLPSTQGGQISLSQFRGKTLVLLEFHVNDFGVT
jgi:peroxiredoxin